MRQSRNILKVKVRAIHPSAKALGFSRDILNKQHKKSFVGFIIAIILCLIVCIVLFIVNVNNNDLKGVYSQEETTSVTRDNMNSYLYNKYNKSFELVGDNDHISGYYANVAFKDSNGREFKCLENIDANGEAYYTDNYELVLFTEQLSNSFYSYDNNISTLHVSVDGDDCTSELFGSLDNFLAKHKVNVTIVCKQDIHGTQNNICTIDTSNFISKFVTAYPNCYSCEFTFGWSCVDETKDTYNGKYYRENHKYLVSGTDIVDFGVNRG